MSHYFCPACAVFGKGSTCWNCGTADVERGTPRVDAHVYDWETGGTVHHCVYGGGRQPLVVTGG